MAKRGPRCRIAVKSAPFLFLPVLSTLYYKNGIRLLSKLQSLHQAAGWSRHHGLASGICRIC